MGMFSEIVTETTVHAFIRQITKQLEEHKSDEQATKALRELGRFALTQFEWSTPDWALPYKKLFEE
jgi:hypothetical protein